MDTKYMQRRAKLFKDHTCWRARANEARLYQKTASPDSVAWYIDTTIFRSVFLCMSKNIKINFKGKIFFFQLFEENIMIFIFCANVSWVQVAFSSETSYFKTAHSTMRDAFSRLQEGVWVAKKHFFFLLCGSLREAKKSILQNCSWEIKCQREIKIFHFVSSASTTIVTKKKTHSLHRILL